MTEREVRKYKEKTALLKTKIEATNQKIADLQVKMEALLVENEEYKMEIVQIEEAEKLAKEAAEEKELLELIQASGKSKDEIRAFLKHQ